MQKANNGHFPIFRIMVLDNGGIVEFDSPGALLSAGGIFQSMAMSAGLV